MRGKQAFKGRKLRSLIMFRNQSLSDPVATSRPSLPVP